MRDNVCVRAWLIALIAVYEAKVLKQTHVHKHADHAQAAFKSSDMYFLERLYDAMVVMGDTGTLLASDAPHLERFFAQVCLLFSS